MKIVVEYFQKVIIIMKVLKIKKQLYCKANIIVIHDKIIIHFMIIVINLRNLFLLFKRVRIKKVKISFIYNPFKMK